MKREVGPAAIRLELGKFGEPLRDHVVAAGEPRPGDDTGKLRSPGEFECHFATRQDRVRQRDANVGLVRGVSWAVSLGTGPEILATCGECVDSDVAPLLGFLPAAKTARGRRPHEHGALVLEGVEVEVEPHLALLDR